ncbi:MAG: hypothetical protein NXH72_01775 [Hyphomonadaceae bacterium]|nr:hypothetical protein [Hyphomonadaceae bacterium]
MSGRDAYLELGYHQKPVKTPEATPKNELVDQPMETDTPSYLAIDPAQYSATPGYSDPAVQSERSGDYLAGLIVILVLLFAGALAGYFGRGWLSDGTSRAVTPTILSAQPNAATEMFGATGTPSAMVFGSTASDQVLAVDMTPGGDALLLVKSYVGPNATDTETRLFSTSAPSDSGVEAAPIELTSLQGEGLHLTRLDDGALIAFSIDGNELIVARLTDSGREVWRQSFAASAVDRSEVAYAKDTNGLVFMAPSSSRTLTQLVSISSDGNIAWERVFDRPDMWHNSFVSIDQTGLTYAVLGPASDDQTFGDQIIALVDTNGRLLRQRALALDASDMISGVAPRAAGGVSFFVSGDMPRLIQINESAQSAGTIDLPYMQYLSDAHIIPVGQGDMFIASTYAPMGDRIDLVLEKRTADGTSLGQLSWALPAGATMDDMVKLAENRYLIAGSVRSDRYMPTDVFVQEISFVPNDRTLAMAAESAQPVSLAEESASSNVQLAETENTTESLPLIASLTVAAPSLEVADAAVAPIEAPTDEQESSATETENVISEPVVPAADLATAVSETEEPLTVETDGPNVVQMESGVEFIVDENAAAISRFIDGSIVTQCRFTCLDPATSNSFPMTGHFLPALLSTAQDASALHTRVCESADLAPDVQTRPTCGFN